MKKLKKQRRYIICPKCGTAMESLGTVPDRIRDIEVFQCNNCGHQKSV